MRNDGVFLLITRIHRFLSWKKGNDFIYTGSGLFPWAALYLSSSPARS